MEKLISEDAILAVKKGINWLDENHPGWASCIDLSNLDMGDCGTCIIGQAVGDYTRVVSDQQTNGDTEEGAIWSIEHGFESPGIYLYTRIKGSPTYGYDDLDVLWTDEVERRLG